MKRTRKRRSGGASWANEMMNKMENAGSAVGNAVVSAKNKMGNVGSALGNAVVSAPKKMGNAAGEARRKLKRIQLERADAAERRQLTKQYASFGGKRKRTLHRKRKTKKRKTKKCR